MSWKLLASLVAVAASAITILVFLTGRNLPDFVELISNRGLEQSERVRSAPEATQTTVAPERWKQTQVERVAPLEARTDPGIEMLTARAEEEHALGSGARTEPQAAQQQVESRLTQQRPTSSLARYLNPGAMGSEAQVLVVEDGRIDAAMSQEIAGLLKGRIDLFTPSFVSDGLFATAYQGDSAVLVKLGLGAGNGPIYLFQKESTLTQSDWPQPGLVKAQTLLRGRRYTPAHRFTAEAITARGVGAAFSRTEALRRSEREAVAALGRQPTP